MLSALPTPVLSVAADAVRDLEGRDALKGLWTLFTKCKESLQDGRRLENISWRLWYREMMRDDSINRHFPEKVNEQEIQDYALSPQVQGRYTPTDLYRPPTPLESTPVPPAYAVQDTNGLNDASLNYQPLLMSATTMLPQNHHHATSSPTFPSSILGPTEVSMFRSISPADPTPCSPVDSTSASFQMSKSKLNSDTVLSPVVPVHPFPLSLSASPSSSKSRDSADHARPSFVQSTQKRRATGFQAPGSNPLCVGRIIYDMLPCSVSHGNEASRSCWSKISTTTAEKSTSVECIPTPLVDPSGSPLTPTTVAGFSDSNEPTSATVNTGSSPTHATTSCSTPCSTTNSRYTSLHAAPPSPSLSDSYANAHPGEVEASDTTRLDVGVGLGPSLSISASSPSSAQRLGNAHISGLPPDSQVPPRLVVVNPTPNPTPNLTPHPTPPASPLPAFASTSSVLATTSGTSTSSNNNNDFEGSKGNWLTLPPDHHPNRVRDLRQDQNRDRSRSNFVATTDINSVSPLSFLPPQPPPPQHQQMVPRQLQKEEKVKGREHSNPSTLPQPQPHQQVISRQSQKEEKVKARSHSSPNSKPRTSSKANSRSPPANKTNTKHSIHETLNMVSFALDAKVQDTLADPLLPGQHKKTIVLTTSESEYEDSDDDGSWSSEEMGTEDEQEAAEQHRQEQLLAQQYQQQQLQRQLQQQQLQQRPPPLQRAHSSNQPSTANHNATHAAIRTQRTQSSRGSQSSRTQIHGVIRAQRTQSSRAHRQSSNPAQAHAQALLAQAAEEAQREREMFAKKPTESFQNLTQVARTQSVGLLSQLMNPNPEIFPVGHPYRRGYSSSEIRGANGHASTNGGDKGRDRGFRPLQPLMDGKATKTNNIQGDKSDERRPPSHPEAEHRRSSSTSVHSRPGPPARTFSMQKTKSAAAIPVSSEVQAESVGAHTSNAVGGHGAVNGFGMTNMKMPVSSNHSSGGYRPRGRPHDQELEDESGSDGESSSGIQLSKSVAQQKLKALAERKGIVTPATTTANHKTQLSGEHDVPDWAKVSQPRLPPRTRSHDQYPQSQAPDHNANRRSLNALHLRQMSATHSSPIPVGHPYNLPPPAPPSTPRTTRRLMLSNELSESLRRNLLWERQVSKVNLAAVRRTASTGGNRVGGVQPLTTAPQMVVTLLPKGTMRHPNPGSPVGPQHDVGGIKERRASDGAGEATNPSAFLENEKERRRLAMARNRSWANDYHFSGW